MKVQILINHYHEPQELIGRLLDSISGQEGLDSWLDVGVIICSDGKDNPLEQEFLDRYHFPSGLHYMVQPHCGVCDTRNTLLDHAEADYVMFCDADDCFHRQDGLAKLLKCAQEENADVLNAPFLQELKNDNGFRTKVIRDAVVWLHSKLFRLGYLRDVGIRFPAGLKSSGDMGFLWLARVLTEKSAWFAEPVYTWKWNPDSITRALRFHNLRMYGRMLRGYEFAADDLIARGREDLYFDLIALCISVAYVDCHCQGWKKAPAQYVREAEEACGAFIRKFRGYYDALPEAVRKQKYRQVLFAKRTKGPESGFEGLKEWVGNVTS